LEISVDMKQMAMEPKRRQWCNQNKRATWSTDQQAAKSAKRWA